MAIDFKLEYTNGIEYIDIFPRTKLEGIIDRGNNLYDIQLMQVTIPANTAQGYSQTISIDTSGGLENCGVQMYLLNESEQTLKDYSTIDQFQVLANQLVINRLYSYPTHDVTVELVFFKIGG